MAMQLDLFRATEDRLESRVGHSHKKRHKRLTAVVACWMLQQSNFLIEFPEEEAKRLGCGNIWDYLGYKFPVRGAGFIPIAAPNEFQRYESARMNAPHIRNGFKGLVRALLADHHLPLFMVPRQLTRKVTQVITLDPDYIVNDAGITAAQMAEQRQLIRTKWSVRSAAEKLAAMTNVQAACLGLLKQISGVFDDINKNGLPSPKMSAIDAVNMLGDHRGGQ